MRNRPEPRLRRAIINTVEKWDPKTGKWTYVAPMHSVRGDYSIDALASGRLLVVGGETTDGVRTQLAQHEVEEYNPAEDVW